MNFIHFWPQKTSSSGKGPCSLACDREKRGTQIHATKAYVAEHSSKHAWCETIEENTNPQVVPGTGLED